MGKRRVCLLMAVMFLLIQSSCRRDQYRVNTGGIHTDIKIARLEKDLFSISPGTLKDSIGYLRDKYGSFLRYFGYVINIGEQGDSAWNTGLLNFCTDRLNNEVYGSVEKVFADISNIEKGLSEGFSHYKYYFAAAPVPKVYTCITGFNNSLITVKDTLLGISLDRYLGSGSKYYQQLGIYKYQTLRMTPENIVPDCMYGWATAEWDYQEAGYESGNVLTMMIHEGKKFYFSKCMLPETKDELIFGFTEAQLKFCRNNEGRMWEYLMGNNLLFSSDQLTMKKLTGDAPFTTSFSSESPGRAVLWIGFRIVESYMRKNSDVTLEQLMSDKNIHGILENAKYHPPAK